MPTKDDDDEKVPPKRRRRKLSEVQYQAAEFKVAPPDPLQQQDSPQPEHRNRKRLASQVVLDPTSLVGSHFLVFENDEPVFSGIVVAEPQAGMYLCHMARFNELLEEVQMVVPLVQMVVTDDDSTEWMFFDSHEGVVSTYSKFVKEVSD